MEQQRGLSGTWQRRAVNRWGEMRRPDWKERALILEEKHNWEWRRRREEEEYKKMEKRRRLEERQRRGEEQRRWEEHLRWKMQQRKLEQQKLEAEQRRREEEEMDEQRRREEEKYRERRRLEELQRMLQEEQRSLERERLHAQRVGDLRTAQQMLSIEEEDMLLKGSASDAGVSGGQIEDQSGQRLRDSFEGLFGGTIGVQSGERRLLLQECQAQALPETGAQAEVEGLPGGASASEELFDPPPWSGNGEASEVRLGSWVM